MLRVRKYGSAGPVVVLLHGGPGAAGSMAPVARSLADSFRVLEPLQRGGGGGPLTVALHVADLHEVLESFGGSGPPALVGHSWGAMLALAYAAQHPGRTQSLVLVGCGTFDEASRERTKAIWQERMSDAVRRRLESLPAEFPDADERLRAMGDLLLPLYSFDLLTSEQEVAAYDARANRETWDDMVRLQKEGVYPAAFRGIEEPALMLHGAHDPHPGRMIRESLSPYLPQLEYHEWERCGHYPWLEKAVAREFSDFLRQWLPGQQRGSRSSGR